MKVNLENISELLGISSQQTLNYFVKYYFNIKLPSQDYLKTSFWKGNGNEGIARILQIKYFKINNK